MGVGLWPLVLTFGLLSPSSGGVSGGRGSSDRADVLVGSAVSLLCCALLPVCTSELFGLSVVPLEHFRSLLRCLRPRSSVISLNPGLLLGSPPRWCVT